MSDPTSPEAADREDQTSAPTDPATTEPPMTDPTTPLAETRPADEAGTSGTAWAAEPPVAAELGRDRAPDPMPDSVAGRDRRGPSVPTVVWGLLFGLVAAVVIVDQTSEVDLNLEVSAPLALLAAGIVLVVWGVAGLGRARRTP